MEITPLTDTEVEEIESAYNGKGQTSEQKSRTIGRLLAQLHRYHMPGHKCRKIAQVPDLDTGREMWVGELLGSYGDYPETHCIHITTPEKSVVFGVNAADAAILAVVAQIIHGMPVNQRWIDIMEHRYRQMTEN